jgi:hypothetical protein
MVMENILSGLISEETVEQLLPVLFPDSLIINRDYIITGIGEDAAELLKTDKRKLLNQPIALLGFDVKARVRKNLERGYFTKSKMNLLNIENKLIPVLITGFYLGLISNIDGPIILTIRPAQNPGTIL